MAAADLDGGEDVVDRARNGHRDGHLAVVGGIGGVLDAAAGVEARFSGDRDAQIPLQGMDVDSGTLGEPLLIYGLGKHLASFSLLSAMGMAAQPGTEPGGKRVSQLSLKLWAMIPTESRSESRWSRAER